MVRTNNEFRAFIERMDGGGLKCLFCGQTFAASTTITRFKWHLSGLEGHGVRVCAQVPPDIREKAQQASNWTVASSSNVHEVVQEQTTEVGYLAGEEGRMQMENLPLSLDDFVMETDVDMVTAIELMDVAVRGSSLERFIGDELRGDLVGQPSSQPVVSSSSPRMLPEPRGDSSQPADLHPGRYDDQHWTPSLNNDVMMNDVENIVREPGQPVAGDSSLQCDGDDSSVEPFPTKKLVGEEFEINKNAIWSWLMNDEASYSLGVYGMGGVGKTTLLIHIYNLLIKPPKSFHHVSLATVSQDFSISKLKNHIAKDFGLDLSREDCERKRAAKLSKELSKKQQRWVLILDDIWKYFDFDVVGIPIQVKGCKVILTSRSSKVCEEMLCQRKIEVHPLSSEEAWTMFMENLGCHTALPPNVEQVAERITRECAGLPLAIKTIARTMRGVVDMHRWRNLLRELEESKVRQDDMEPEVFRILRYSYTHLKDSALQQCFLYCSLFPEDFEIDRNNLIAYLIDEGVIEGMKSRQAEIDKGHVMINKLLDVCLLETGRDSSDGYVRMHDLMRDMALQIMQQDSRVIVKAGAQLEELPDTEEWTKNLVRVSLVANRIQGISPVHSPRCPYLLTLLLCDNKRLGPIAESFFKHMHRLKVLDLSNTRIRRVPDSVSDLESLIALLLINCVDLKHVPSLKKLKALKRLDLSKSAIFRNMPQGMECLTNLSYLRLNRCGRMEFPCGILSKLSHLQVLIIEEFWYDKWAPVIVKGKEVACLKRLETLECHFAVCSDFVEYFKSLDRTTAPNRYKIVVGVHREERGYREIMEGCLKDKTVVLGYLSIKREVEFQLMFPKSIQDLVLLYCDDARSLCDVSSSIGHAANLERINVQHCDLMESMVSSSWLCSAPRPLPSNNGIFSGLKECIFHECGSMKELFPLILVPNLINLEVIRVTSCYNMKEIIETRDEESSSSYSISEEFTSLEKLRILELSWLPKLKSICSGKLVCDSLEVLKVRDCQRLKRIPIWLPLIDNGQPSSPPSLKKSKYLQKNGGSQ